MESPLISAGKGVSDRMNHESSQEFKEQYNNALQYFMSRCQHHIHKLATDPKTKEQKRLVPNACASKKNRKECKHEAPWTNRVSPTWMSTPLTVCKGIAKKFGLKTSGVRNWMGQTLGMRNNEWLNGCMPGLCVAFAGSNSDIKPNDRLPIIASTHEECCKRKRCLKNRGCVKRATYATQRTQSVTNGYFGGYIGKRQPAGSLETQKCVDKLLTLRAKMQGRGRAAQLRASSGRLITELEMNSTYRGAVEIFNLCCNLDEKDVLKAECVRTFGSVTIDGRQWMHRLEEAQETRQMKDCSITTYVPPNKKPNVRTSTSRVNEFEAYGFRPMEHPGNCCLHTNSCNNGDVSRCLFQRITRVVASPHERRGQNRVHRWRRAACTWMAKLQRSLEYITQLWGRTQIITSCFQLIQDPSAIRGFWFGDLVLWLS